MPIIVPTITAENSHVYREQIERVEGFAQRIHIDLMDGVFTPNKSISVEAAWWPKGTQADIHLMHQLPDESLEKLIKLKPSLVIVPAESDCDFEEFSRELNNAGIDCGIAVMPDTNVDSIIDDLPFAQQVLIFSGNLGHQGGSIANLDLLSKVQEIEEANPELIVAWDGGVNKSNVQALIDAGIEVLNVGGAIQHALDAGLAYRELEALLP